MRPENIIKCKYCDYFCSRFKGRKNNGTNKLFRHVINEHEDKFLLSVGFSGTLEQYMDMLDGLEDSRFEDTL